MGHIRNGRIPSAESSLHLWNGSIIVKASLDQHCYAPGDSLTLKMMVENTTSVPVVLASLNLVARARAFPLRIQNKPSTYKTKFSKKCWYSRPPFWPSLTSYSLALPSHLPQSSTGSCIDAQYHLSLCLSTLIGPSLQLQLPFMVRQGDSWRMRWRKSLPPHTNLSLYFAAGKWKELQPVSLN